MANYPMTFSVDATTPSEISSAWNSTAARGTPNERTVKCSIPKEFSGPESGFSPEDLFVLALMNCYIATLKVIAANSKLTFASLEASAILTLDRDDPAAAPWMKKAELKFSVTGVQNEASFRRMMERVSKQCMIINSVKTAVVYLFEVRAA